VRRKSEIDYVLSRTSGRGEDVTIPNPVMGAMRQLGLAGTKSNSKFIPEDYLLNSPDVRLAVLQGLLDTDGAR